MSRTILVTGSQSQLGCELQSLVQQHSSPTDWTWHFASHNGLDITDSDALSFFCDKYSINTIINGAAYTAVDKAESEFRKADLVNHIAVKNLALIAKARSISLVHISTDYVFDGNQNHPYRETDIPHPINAYGRSKLAGEQAMQAINPPRSAILRSGWLYSSSGNNFVKTILRLCQSQKELHVVNDQTGTPTHARLLASTIIKLIPTLQYSETELLHYSQTGQCTWYEFACAIAVHTHLPCQINPISTQNYGSAATRPYYSVLDHSALAERLSLAIPHWQDTLATHLYLTKP